MEWRIIVPLLCLIGILHVPGNAAQATTNGTNSTFRIVFHIDLQFKDVYSNMSNNETIHLKQDIISQVVPVYSGLKNFQGFDILAFRNGSVVVDGKLFFNSSDAKPIVANLTQLLHERNFTFTIIKNFTSINEDAPAVAGTAPPLAKTVVSLVFKIDQPFKSVYSNLSDPETQKLTTNITDELSPVYQRLFPKFRKMVIKKLSEGSIVVDSDIEFEATNGTSPNLTEVKNALVEAVSRGLVKISVNASTISVSDPTTNGTGTTTASNNSTANTTVSTTASPPAKIARINVVFKMNQTFNETYSNISHPDTKILSNKIISEIAPFYQKKFPKFFSMWIQKLSRGSIVVDSVFEFDTTNGTSPNLTEVKNTLIEAAANLSFQIDTASINVTDISTTNGTNETTTTTTTTSATTTSAGSSVAEYNITFKIKDTFTTELSNMSSSKAQALEKNISDQCGVAYKYLRSYIRAFVRKFSNGSINVDGVLQFNKTISSPSVAELARTLAEYVRNGTVSLLIDPTTIKVTDNSGNTANNSPVLASMLTAFWMTLASLLLSAVMH